MKNYDKRIDKLEGHLPDEDNEPLFVQLVGAPWTETEKQAALAKYPDCDCFIKPLSMQRPYEEIEERRQAGRPFDMPAEDFRAFHGSSAYRDAIRRMERFRNSAFPDEGEMQ
ncbi:hypothetical protein PDESU_00729 [Pontiella desulfatans]|uniref:Uncharacterized protein n=1 Tax=Pontiella desulfatans TaxID=2750659 RepID=A0A6C2TWY2_PONDE|nr:hypothetical protein [Pontiella desulfatans]VGO12178.1 hypothetical protein PDESU_00729 [Pontiella desulfatans]